VHQVGFITRVKIKFVVGGFAASHGQAVFRLQAGYGENMTNGVSISGKNCK
jgi:hypothetical protein